MVNIHGESGGVSQKPLDDEIIKLQLILKDYSREDIYNFDETALFYKLGPNKTLATQKTFGRKRNKERIQISLCTNAVGNRKCKLLVIGKSAKPRCFDNKFKVEKFVDYFFNQKAWMKHDIFAES